MKYLLILILFISFNSMGQDTLYKGSLFENFAFQQGKLFKKQQYLLGRVNKLQVYCCQYTTENANENRKAIYLSDKVTGSFIKSFDAPGIYIDFVDLDTLIYLLKKYSDFVKVKNPDNEPAYFFETLNNLSINCIWQEETKAWSVVLWRGRRQSELLQPNDLSEIINILYKAKDFNFKP